MIVEEEELFTERSAEEGEQESTEDEDVDEDEEKKTETERKSGLDISKPSVSLANRGASLPCPGQLSAMHLTHLNHLTHLTHLTHPDVSSVSMRHRLKGGEARKGPHSQHDRNQDKENEPKCETRQSAISNLLHVPEKRRCFRSRSVVSLSDADRVCLICHDDLLRRGGTIRELHCSHSFHSECIEDWLWMKQTCPVCHKHMAMPEPLYWTSAHVKVP